MDFKEIQELIKLVNRYKLEEFALERKDFKLNIKAGSKQESSEGTVAGTAFLPPAHPIQFAPPVIEHAPPTQVPPATAISEKKEEPGGDNFITVKAPMIGTFYRRPAPDKDAYINVGDTVSKGSVLCVIEAMKLFNEIESEVEGKIVKILVEDHSPVEYDQPMFLIDPNG